MKDIRIALYGQFDNDTKFAFTYPDDFNPAMATAKDAWLKSIRDPRDAREFNAERIYTLWKDAEGNYYGIIVPNRQDTRNGYILLTLFVGSQLPTSGHAIINILQQLEQMLITEGQRDKQVVGEYVESIRHFFVSDLSVPPTTQKVQTRAFRLYDDELELADLLLYPNQQEYAPFTRILLVPKANAPQNALANYQELHNTIRHSYTVSTPDGVKVDKRNVVDGTTMVITYNRTGFSPMSYKVTVKSIGSRLYSVNGSTIMVKSAEEAGISFSRKARLDIRSSKTSQPLSMVVVDGMQMQNGTDLELGAEEVKNYKISAPGYSPATVRVSLAEMVQKNFVLTVYLEPKDENMRVIASIDGKKVEGAVRIAQDDKLYPYLREPHNYEVKIERRKGGSSSSVTDKGGGSSNNWLKMLLCAIAGLIIGFLIAGALSSNSDDDDDDVTVTTPGNVINNNDNNNKPKDQDEREDEDGFDDEDDDEDDAYAQVQAAFEQHDLIFLKKRDIWMADSIQSDKYKDLYFALERGDYNSLLDHEYSQLPDADNNLNGYWQTIRNDLLKLQNDGNETALKECSNEMKRLSRAGKCTIRELASAIKGIAHPAGNGGASRGRTDGQGQGAGSQTGGNTPTTTTAPPTPGGSSAGGNPPTDTDPRRSHGSRGR